MNGLDYPAQLAAQAKQAAATARAKARREGQLDRLEPAFPYRCIPFRPGVFGAIPNALRDREE
jgi:hypothetical protein